MVMVIKINDINYTRLLLHTKIVLYTAVLRIINMSLVEDPYISTMKKLYGTAAVRISFLKQ